MVADQTRLTRPSTQNSWVSKKALSGGGHLIWLGIHWLDLVQYITGDRVHKVGGFISNVGGQPVDIEDAAVLSLLYKSGMVGTMHSGYYLDRGYHSHVAIWGEKGWLRFDLTAQQPLEWHSTLEGMPQGIQTFSYSRGTNFYLGIIQAAVDCAPGSGGFRKERRREPGRSQDHLRPLPGGEDGSDPDFGLLAGTIPASGVPAAADS